jgi:hypothetical protein
MSRLKLTDEESVELFNRVLEAMHKMKKGFFSFRKLRGVHGYCLWEEGIELDHRKDLIPTIIHECIHFIEQDWPENKVLYAEKRIMNIITEDDIILLLKIFVKKI